MVAETARTLDDLLREGWKLVVSYGMGVDSTAMIVGLKARGIVPDMILFADVGDEKPETYKYIDTISRWLSLNGFPDLTIVKYEPKRFKHGPYKSLFGNCWQNRTLPSLAFGRKACSNKWKIAPMDKHVEVVYADELARGEKIIRAIGYDAGCKDSRRGGNITESDKYAYAYPLRDWGWTREQCKLEIALEAELQIPPKSACFFCPSTQKDELLQFALDEPFLTAMAILMEDRAKPNLRTIEGLWRRKVKGTRNPAAAKPGDWRTFLEQQGVMPSQPILDFVLERMDELVREGDPAHYFSMAEIIRRGEVFDGRVACDGVKSDDEEDFFPEKFV